MDAWYYEKRAFLGEKRLRETKCIFKKRDRIPKVQIRKQILMTGNAAAVENTQVWKKSWKFSSLGIRRDKEFKQQICVLRELLHGCTQSHIPAMPGPTTAALLPVPTPGPAPAVPTWAMAWGTTRAPGDQAQGQRSWEHKFSTQTKDQFSPVRWQPPQHLHLWMAIYV